MMKLRVLLMVLIFTLALTSCNLPTSGGDDSGALVQTQVALNVAMTQLANTLTAVAQPVIVQTEPPAAPEQPTPTLTASPLDTPTVTLTPEPLFTPTPEGVWLVVNQNTNCRAGPGSIYELMGTVNASQRVQASARNPYNDYYYVRFPTIYGEFCWLWNRYASIEGDINILPVFTPQPTPTVKATYTPTPAPANFDVSFLDVQTDGGASYGIQLFVTNTGNLTWKSIKVVLTDNTNSLTYTHTHDTFRGTDGGVIDVGNEQEDLVFGESSRVACVNPGQFGYNPAGRSFTAVVTLYANDGLTGTNITKTITFTP